LLKSETKKTARMRSRGPHKRVRLTQPFVIDNSFLKGVLSDLGMIEGASEIYIFLLKKGPKLAADITHFIGGNKALIYRRLKFLLSNGFVKSTLGYPALFEVVPLDSIVNQFVESKKRELHGIKKNRRKLQEILKTIDVETEPARDEFSIMKSSHLGIIKCLEIAKQTKMEYLIMNDQLSPIQDDFVKDVQLIASHTLRKKAKFRFITNVDYGNLSEAKELTKKLNLDGPYIEIHHLALDPNAFPRFALGDERAIVFYFDTWDSERILDPGKLFWTNSLAFIRSMKLLFNEMWCRSTDIRKRIAEVEGTESAFLTSQNEERLSQLSFAKNLIEDDYSFYKNGCYTCGNHELAKTGVINRAA
jgi:sugar-specific transcriptional regulator TrmB